MYIHNTSVRKRTHTYTYVQLHVHSLFFADINYRDSRRSSTGSCQQVGNYSMNLCTQAFNMINFKNALARDKGGGINSREGSNSNSVRNVKDKSILDSFLNGKCTCKDGGRQLLAPPCASKVPEEMGYSTLDSKHSLTPIYLSHQKVDLEFQKYKGMNFENDEDNNTGSLTDGQNEEYSHDYGLHAEKIQIAPKRKSRIPSVLTAKTVSRCTSYTYSDAASNNLETGCEYEI